MVDAFGELVQTGALVALDVIDPGGELRNRGADVARRRGPQFHLAEKLSHVGGLLSGARALDRIQTFRQV